MNWRRVVDPAAVAVGRWADRNVGSEVASVGRMLRRPPSYTLLRSNHVILGLSIAFYPLHHAAVANCARSVTARTRLWANANINATALIFSKPRTRN